MNPRPGSVFGELAVIHQVGGSVLRYSDGPMPYSTIIYVEYKGSLADRNFAKHERLKQISDSNENVYRCLEITEGKTRE